MPGIERHPPLPPATPPPPRASRRRFRRGLSGWRLAAGLLLPGLPSLGHGPSLSLARTDNWTDRYNLVCYRFDSRGLTCRYTYARTSNSERGRCYMYIHTRGAGKIYMLHSRTAAGLPSRQNPLRLLFASSLTYSFRSVYYIPIRIHSTDKSALERGLD